MSSDTVAVGIDVGSSQARVAVCSSDNAARVVSNTLGHRSTLAMTTLEHDNHHVYGEAALRLLQKEKKPTPSVRDMLLSSDNDDEEENTSSDGAACEAFLGHLGSLASDATASSPQQLRLVLSVPMDASSEYIDTIKGVTEAGIKKSISDKKQRKHHVVVGVISDPAAVCIAHGLTDHTSTKQYGNILVIDAGASGLNISHLQTNGTSRILSLVNHRTLNEVSGPALVTVLSQHVASQFERKYKIPAGEVWETKKARYKLLQACESTLQSLKNSTSTIHITIDGLYEGMDCHIPLSKPRWEMLTSPLLRKAQAFLEDHSSIQPDAVLLAGSGWSFLEASVEKTFPGAYRGIANVPPEEAVALGCALHAASCLEHEKVKLTAPTHSDVVLSPVEIGIGSDESNLVTIIGKGTPLPAHVVHILSPQPDAAIWQVQPSIKRLAGLQMLPKDQDVEVVIELNMQGNLSIAVQGGPITTI